MTRGGLRLVTVLGVLLALSGCGGTPPAGPPTLREADSGSTLTIAHGRSFEVALSANASTGYQWQAVIDDTGCVRQTDYSYSAPSGTPGAGGTATFRFLARSPGRTTITLAYVRPWETGIPPHSVVGYVIVVT